MNPTFVGCNDQNLFWYESRQKSLNLNISYAGISNSANHFLRHDKELVLLISRVDEVRVNELSRDCALTSA